VTSTLRYTYRGYFNHLGCALVYNNLGYMRLYRAYCFRVVGSFNRVLLYRTHSCYAQTVCDVVMTSLEASGDGLDYVSINQSINQNVFN